VANTKKYIWNVTFEAQLTPENAELFDDRIKKDAEAFAKVGSYVSKTKMEAKVSFASVPVQLGT